MSEHTPTPSESLQRFVISMIVFGSILAVIAFGSYEELNTSFTNEYLKFGALCVVAIVEGVGIHVITNAVKHRLEVGERFIVSKSFGFHSCNADPTHCFNMNGKPMPICARHFGLYGTLTVLGLSVLTIPAFWIVFAKSLSWNIHLVIFFILLIAVVVEGGLGKAGNINQTNSLRWLGGVLSAWGWPFFAMFFISLFNLLK